MSSGLPIDAVDLAAAAYGRRKPRWPVIPETTGLALILLVNRNTCPERAAWLVDPVISEALCVPAEAFAQVLAGRPSPEGWRAAGLASLRTLVPGALGETTEQWPWTRNSEPAPVTRFWLADDDNHFGWNWKPSPVWVELLRRLVAQPRLEEAWNAMITAFRNSGPPGRRSRYYGHLCGYASAHESPAHTRGMRRQLLGPDAE